ncbi:MAG: hypothetical protein JWL63_2578 [Rhodocyclales bacterium]|nr:hypothetical protein [Rhodocyclales bacterium]
MKTNILYACLTTAMFGVLPSCAQMEPMSAPMAPAAVTPPAGHAVAMSTVGKGELTYECRARADMPNAFDWALVGPVATLMDKNQKAVGKYYAGPTWESNDGSKVTGKQVAVSPNPGAIPLQLVKADPAMGNGSMSGISYVQRLNTQGGVAPAMMCDASKAGMKSQVPYQADYVFYKASM